jgi:hypothetical protein
MWRARFIVDPRGAEVCVTLVHCSSQLRLDSVCCGSRLPLSVESAERRAGLTLSRPSRNQTGFRTHSTLSRTGYFWMICRFTSARIFPQRGCKLNEPNGFEPLRRVHDRIIRVFWPINFAHKR